MAFRLAQSETYKAKVVVSLPTEKARFEKSDFTAEFKRFSTEDLEEFRKTLTNREVVEKAIVGWSGVLDDDNLQVPFNEDNLKAMLAIPQALNALIQAFWGSIFEAREKN